jgi:nucleoside phosphorylase
MMNFKINSLLIGVLLLVSTNLSAAIKQFAETITIIVAMENEAKPIIEIMEMESTDAEKLGFNPQLGLSVYFKEISGKNVFLITNGKDPINGVDRIGTQAAALTAYAVIETLHPTTIISAGTAGGLRDAKIGDVYVSDDNFVFCDRIISLPSYREYGTGYFRYMPVAAIAQPIGLRLGIVATSNSLDPTERDLDELALLKADVIDMESTAIAEVAQRLGIRMIALKSVTNFLNQDLHADFEKNYAIAVDALAEKMALFMPAFLKSLDSESDNR